MYYGAILDMPVKQTLAVNAAYEHAMQVIPTGTDQTPPSIWYIMRHPYNPGTFPFSSVALSFR